MGGRRLAALRDELAPARARALLFRRSTGGCPGLTLRLSRPAKRPGLVLVSTFTLPRTFPGHPRMLDRVFRETLPHLTLSYNESCRARKLLRSNRKPSFSPKLSERSAP